MTIKYKDVSHYSGAYKPTGPTCAKATEGTSFVDPQFTGIRQRTKNGGWPFLAYHFLAHGNIAAQVAHVIATIGKAQPLMLDVESEAGNPDPTLADVTGFADAYAAAGGRVTLAYIPKWFWSGHWHSPSLTGLKTRRIGLVSSNYTTYSDGGPGWGAYGGVTPVIWQFTSTPLDTNAYRGTAAELAALFAGTTVPATTEADMELTDKVALVKKPDVSYSADSTTVAGILASTNYYVLQTRNQMNTQFAAVLKLLDPAAIAGQIVAKLPASGLTQAQITAGVKAALDDITLTVSADDTPTGP